MGYTKRAITGFSLHSGFTYISAGVAVVKLALVARILTPTSFGLFSIVMIGLGLSEAATQTGVNLTIIQSNKKPSYFLNSAWIIAIVRGLVIAGIMFFLGWGMSYFYNEPKVWQLTILAASIPIIKGFINPAIIILRKELQFEKDVFFRFSLVMVEAIFAIGLALVLRSVWALILSIMAAAVAEVALSFLLFKDKPKFKYESKAANEIFANLKWLNISSILDYLLENIDNLILGKVLGTTNLGLYHNAYASTHKASYDLSKSVHHSTLPIFTKIVDDPKRLWRAYFRSITTMLFGLVAVSIPILIEPRIIIWILGEQWLPILPSIRYLLLAGGVASIGLMTHTLFLAQKTYIWLTTHQFVGLVSMVLLLLWWAPSGGLLGAAQAIFWSRLISLPIVLVGVTYTYVQSRKN